MSATPEGAFIIKTKTSFASKPPTSFSIIDCEQTIMYSRKSLDSSFGPYKVSICETNIKLEDGTLLSTKVWFPGQKVPFEAASHSPWTTYCEALDNCENEVSPTSKLEFSKHIHLISKVTSLKNNILELIYTLKINFSTALLRHQPIIYVVK